MDSSFLKDDVPLHASTPKTTRKQTPTLRCPHCSRSYVKQHYFQKHLESHSIQGNDDAHNVTQDGTALHLDVSDLSFIGLQDGNNNGGFKKPSLPKNNKKGPNFKTASKKQFVCTYCLKAYVLESGMRKHMRIHYMQVAASRMPDTEELIKNAGDIGESALIKVTNCPSYGATGQRFSEFIGHVVGLSNFCDFSTKLLKELVCSIDSKKCMLPSALLKSLFDEMERVLSNDDLHDECLSLLDVSNFGSDVKSQFLLEFLLNFTTEIFKFISASFRKHFDRPLKPMPELDADDKQVIYYIGGSIMRGYFRIAYRHKGNLKWQKVFSVLKSHVLSSQPVGDIDADWTKDVDRGALLYINMACQKFFISVTKVIYENEKRDGSLDYDQVISIVSKSNISVQWDEIIGDALPEDLSVGLMTDVVKCFCKACGRGIARRRLNALREKPVISMPTRHAVASRKQ